MRDSLLLCILFSFFVLCSPALAHDSVNTLGNAPADVTEHGNPLAKLTGTVWQHSSLDSKKALLLGVECSVILEHYIDAKRQAQARTGVGTRSPSILSPFQKGWAQVFSGVNSEEVVSRIDAWYAVNPDKVERPVFSVIWYELIAPHYKQ